MIRTEYSLFLATSLLLVLSIKYPLVSKIPPFLTEIHLKTLLYS